MTRCANLTDSLNGEPKRYEVHIQFEITDLYHVPFESVMRPTLSPHSMGEVFFVIALSCPFQFVR